MTKRISNIAPYQAAKVLALAYVGMGGLFALLFVLAQSIVGDGMAGGSVLSTAILYLILFPAIGYASGALFALFYNWAAQKVGGIELVLEDVEAT